MCLQNLLIVRECLKLNTNLKLTVIPVNDDFNRPYQRTLDDDLMCQKPPYHITTTLKSEEKLDNNELQIILDLCNTKVG